MLTINSNHHLWYQYLQMLNQQSLTIITRRWMVDWHVVIILSQSLFMMAINQTFIWLIDTYQMVHKRLLGGLSSSAGHSWRQVRQVHPLWFLDNSNCRQATDLVHQVHPSLIATSAEESLEPKLQAFEEERRATARAHVTRRAKWRQGQGTSGSSKANRLRLIY